MNQKRHRNSTNKNYVNVWDAIEETPEAAAEMTMRSDLMITLTEHLKTWKVTQAAAAAKRLDITQPRYNDLVKGRINKFSVDALITLARRAGLIVELKIKKTA
jgi:predicted XRE-type DNA-binding protein